jgi:hypothetical protein
MNTIRAILIIVVGLILFIVITSVLGPLILGVGALMVSVLAIALVLGLISIIFKCVKGK